MKTYTKFLVNGFVKSFLNVFLVMISLVCILNILKEIEFLSKVVIKVLLKKLLSIFDEFIILVWLLTTSFIHNPFLFITAK